MEKGRLSYGFIQQITDRQNIISQKTDSGRWEKLWRSSTVKMHEKRLLWDIGQNQPLTHLDYQS